MSLINILVMFSKSCKYAIRSILYLSIHSSIEKKMGVKEMADTLQIPKHFLGKILQQLSRYNLVSSVKGPSGGFYLSKAEKSNTLVKVIKCMDGPDIFDQCILGLPVCSSNNPCALHDQAMEYRTNLVKLLSENSIEDIARHHNMLRISF